MSDALDQIHEPVFFDGGHTNELGARVVARTLYLKLRPQLRQIVAGS